MSDRSEGAYNPILMIVVNGLFLQFGFGIIRHLRCVRVQEVQSLAVITGWSLDFEVGVQHEHIPYIHLRKIELLVLR